MKLVRFESFWTGMKLFYCIYITDQTPRSVFSCIKTRKILLWTSARSHSYPINLWSVYRMLRFVYLKKMFETRNFVLMWSDARNIFCNCIKLCPQQTKQQQKLKVTIDHRSTPICLYSTTCYDPPLILIYHRVQFWSRFTLQIGPTELGSTPCSLSYINRAFCN